MSPTLRESVRRRAGLRCEYCKLLESAVEEVFSVDHVVARKHGGRTSLENLALACLRCNLHKGTDLSAIDPRDGAVVRLYDPRASTWTEHFAFNVDGTILGLTPAGRATVRLLHMNAFERVLHRRRLLLDGISLL